MHGYCSDPTKLMRRTGESFLEKQKSVNFPNAFIGSSKKIENNKIRNANTDFGTSTLQRNMA